MLYPARCKRITVDESKVLKNRLFRFFGGHLGHPVYNKMHIYVKGTISETKLSKLLKMRIKKKNRNSGAKWIGGRGALLI